MAPPGRDDELRTRPHGKPPGPGRPARSAGPGQVRGHVAVEAVHLVEQLGEGPVPEPDLEMADAHGRELVEAGRDRVRGADERRVADVPPGRADVEELGDRAEVDRLVAATRP